MNDETSDRSERGVYGISVTSELSGLGQHTLRLYERRGLLSPARSGGGTRRYSEDDLVRLRRIVELLADGVNLAGIAQILALEQRNTQLESDNADLILNQREGAEKQGSPGDLAPHPDIRRPVHCASAILPEH